MIIAAFFLFYLFAGIITQVSLIRAHRNDGVEFKEFWPGRWERIGITLATIVVWPYVLYSWFFKPEVEVEIPER